MHVKPADDARRALKGYSTDHGNLGEPLDYQVSDLISDLLHILAQDEPGVDPKYVVERALADFRNELTTGSAL